MCLLNQLPFLLFLITIFSNNIQCVTSKDVYIGFSLDGYNKTNTDSQVFDFNLILDAESTYTIALENIPQYPASFIIFQVHTHISDVSLSYNHSLIPRYYLNGTNIGLVYLISDATKEFYIINSNSDAVSSYISAHVYQHFAPLPGGCNMEFNVEIAPYQQITLTDHSIIVDVQPASLLSSPKQCEKGAIQYDMYHMYLPEQDFSPDAYFSAIKNMSTKDAILSNGRKVYVPLIGSKMRRTYNGYQGTGEIFAVIATYNDFSSVYVPTSSYFCDNLSNNSTYDTCEHLTSAFPRILVATFLFMGIFMCFFGHKFFKTGMFIHGFLVGGLISFISLSLLENYDIEGNLINASLIGVASGLLWLTTWCYFGIPLISITLGGLLLGFIMSATILYSEVADFPIMQLDINYWLLFITIMLFISMIVTSFAYVANLWSCAVIGAFCVIIVLDFYIGSNLKYTLITTLRRTAYSDFNTAIIDPPFQIRDMGLASSWIILSMCGYCFQAYNQRGKPPFPPPPSLYRRLLLPAQISSSSSRPNERTPLVTGSIPSPAVSAMNI